MRPQGSNVQWPYTPTAVGVVPSSTAMSIATHACQRWLGCISMPTCVVKSLALAQVTPGVWQSTLLLSRGLSILTFGEDVQHELYVGSGDGTVYRLVAGQ